MTLAVIAGTLGLAFLFWFGAYKAWDLLLKRENTSGKLWAIILLFLLSGFLMSVVSAKAVFDAGSPERLAVVNKTNVSNNTTHLDYAVVTGQGEHNTAYQTYWLTLSIISIATGLVIVHFITAYWQHTKDLMNRGRGGR